MESDGEEFELFSDASENPSSPVPERKLKRLRKAAASTTATSVPEDPLPHSPNVGAPSISQVNSSEVGARDEADEDAEDFGEPVLRSGSPSESFEEEVDGFGDEQGGRGFKQLLEFDSVADDDVEGRSRDQTGGLGVEEEIGDLEIEEEGLEKKLPDPDELEESKEKEKKQKRRRRVKSDGDDNDDGFLETTYIAASSKRERRERFTELRAESQRLLRETRDASFKPVRTVRKPISSVLEKIRQRKRQILQNSLIGSDDALPRETALDFDFENEPIEDIEVVKVAEATNVETIVHSADVEDNLSAVNAEGPISTAESSDKNMASRTVLDEVAEPTFRAPVDDTQDLTLDSQESDSKDDLLDETPSSPQEEVLAPSLLTMNLKLDSAPVDDSSSDEEENDKENIDPRRKESMDLSSSPHGDPVKAFVDEEAEEEDDSDNDLCRFQDNEEDGDNSDSEEVNDMIATGYEEKPIDNEMRNQLHQKWLEQQDATGTENLLRKLKCSSKLTETTLLEEKEDEESENEEDFLEEAEENPIPKNAVRMNLKKAKEMLPLMFTDKDDIYLSSDDEETGKKCVMHHPSDKAEERTTLLSPAKDAASKDIFSHIKKLNGVPDARKKAKIRSYFNMLSLGGNKAMSSKSSFLGRGSKTSLPSFQKNGSNMARSFIFERDDSNGRNAISMPDDASDSIQRQNKQRKTTLAKFSGSQVRSSTQSTQATPETRTGRSLHEILRCPSLQSSSGHCNGDGMVGQVEAIYAAFKLDTNPVRKEPGSSIRTFKV